MPRRSTARGRAPRALAAVLLPLARLLPARRPPRAYALWAVRGLVDFWKKPGAAQHNPYVEVGGLRYVRPYAFESHHWFGRESEGLSPAAALATEVGRGFGQDEAFWLAEFEKGRVAVRTGANKENMGTAGEYKAPGDVMEAGTVVRWQRPVHEPPTPAFPPPAVLFEGEGLIALEKPPMLRTNGRYARHNSAHAWAIRARGGAFACPVHRLDATVGGVMLCATSKASYRSLKRAFEKRQVLKRYVARVAAEPPAGEEHIIRKHLRIKAQKGGDPLAPRTTVNPRGVPAKTTVRCLGPVGDGTSLVECFPESGKHHQIRAHLQHLGWPVANDVAYGGRAPWFRDGPEAYVDDEQGTLAGILGPELGAWRVPGPKDERISDVLAGMAPRPRLSPAIWLFSQRYELPELGIVVEAPLPEWAEGAQAPRTRPSGVMIQQ